MAPCTTAERLLVMPAGTAARCSEQHVCKRRSPTQCAPTSQLGRSNPPLRGKGTWPTRSETASFRIAAGTAASEHSTTPPWQQYATLCPTGCCFASCLYQRRASKPRRLRPFGPAVVAASCEVLFAHCGMAPRAGACDHSVKLSEAHWVGRQQTYFTCGILHKHVGCSFDGQSHSMLRPDPRNDQLRALGQGV